MKLFIGIVMITLLVGCAGLESDDIVKLRLQQEHAERTRTFNECAGWARKSLGEDASAAAQMELTNSCLTMQKGVKESEADTERRERELEAAKQELAETKRKLDEEKQRRDAERERELAEIKRQLEDEKRNNAPQSPTVIVVPVVPSPAPEAGGQENANLSPGVDAGGENFGDLVDKVETLIELNQFAKALPVAKKALRVAERQYGDNSEETMGALRLLSLAYLFLWVGDRSWLHLNQNAQSHVRRALKILPEVTHPKRYTVSGWQWLLNGLLASSCYTRGLHEAPFLKEPGWFDSYRTEAALEAEPFFHCAVKYEMVKLEKGEDDDDSDLKKYQRNLANAYKHLREDEKAAAVLAGELPPKL